MASLKQAKEGLKKLNKKNRELIDIINQITGDIDETITNGVDKFVEVLENKKPVLQDKTVTENGQVIADEGYDGLNKVTVNVKCEVSEPKLQDKGFNKNGVFKADEGYDGFGEITIAVPIEELPTIEGVEF